MYFFEQHFNKHHFFHAPHKWFLALLVSPIHFAELHYKNRYHLKFEHARKLFVFDLTLLLTCLIMLGAVIFWFTYNPGISYLINLSIHPSDTKIMSGQYATYTINYKNTSALVLKTPQLKLGFPVGFLVDKIEPQLNLTDWTINLPDLKPQAAGAITLSGWIYGTPDKAENITAHLLYRQEGRRTREEKTTLFIQTLRGSILAGKIKADNLMVANGENTLALNLKNAGKQTLTQIQVPFTQKNALTITKATSTLGAVENNVWKIERLEPDTEASLNLTLKNDASQHPTKLTANFTPSLTINGTPLPQSLIIHNFTIAYPSAEVFLSWQNGQTSVQPANVATLIINVKNTSAVALSQGALSLSLPTAVVDLPRLAKLNLGKINNQVWTISEKELISLAALKHNETASYNLQIPINYLPQGGADLILRPNVNFKAQVANLPTSQLTAETVAPDLKIGTQVILEPEIRYYTQEGDQLGRGPLPPQVSKETKYWVFIPLTNSTSKIKNLKLTANLPNYVSYTGKSSVSNGNNPVYDNNQRKISWVLNSLPAHTQAGVYFEISWTPSAEQLNT